MRFLSALAVCNVALLAACATPATRPMQFVGNTPAQSSDGVGSGCPVYIRSIEDRRDSLDGFGTSARLELFARHIPEWVKSAVTSLDGRKRRIVMLASAEADAPQDGLTVTVRIHKAYIHNMTTSRTAHIVFSNQYEGGGRVLGTNYYRGADTFVMWSGSADEVERGMNTAMRTALVAMGQDVDRYCGRIASKS